MYDRDGNIVRDEHGNIIFTGPPEVLLPKHQHDNCNDGYNYHPIFGEGTYPPGTYPTGTYHFRRDEMIIPERYYPSEINQVPVQQGTFRAGGSAGFDVR